MTRRACVLRALKPVKNHALGPKVFAENDAPSLLRTVRAHLEGPFVRHHGCTAVRAITGDFNLKTELPMEERL